MIREDRELLAELARINGDMPTMGLRLMAGSAGAAEQEHYAQRLIAAGERLRRRAESMVGVVIEGEPEIQEPFALPTHAVEPVQLDWRP